MKEILKVLVTGAGGNVAYSLLQPLILGRVFGEDQPLHVVLFDLPSLENKLKGIAIELEDCASHWLSCLTVTSNAEDAFKDIDIMVGLAGSMPLKDGVERETIVKANKPIYEHHGKMLDMYAKKTVKVLVVTTPCNTMCLVMMRNAPSIPKENFTCLTRLGQNRVKAKLAMKLENPACCVTKVIIWGNHSKTMVPDVTFSLVKINASESDSPKKLIKDKNFWRSFFTDIQDRAMLVLHLSMKTSALASAVAITDHLREWICGTPQNDFSSMGVYSTGCYDVPEGVFCSFPCKCSNGKYEIVEGFPLDPQIKEMLKVSVEELITEREYLNN